MALTQDESIVIRPDGTALLQRNLVRHATASGEPLQRCTEERLVDAGCILEGYVPPTILPNGCRAFAEQNGVAVYVVECEPTVRTITWHLPSQYVKGADDFYHPVSFGQSFDHACERLRDRGADTTHAAWFAGLAERESLRRGGTIPTFQLAMPYVVFLFRFCNGLFNCVYCFYRNAPLTSLDDALLLANLPNVRNNGMVCLDRRSHYMVSIPSDVTTVPQQVTYISRVLWSNAWNGIFTEYGTPAGAQRFPLVATPVEWEFNSLTDPLFPLSVQWIPAGYSVRKAMAWMLSVMEHVELAGGRTMSRFFGDEQPQPVSTYDLIARRVRYAPCIEQPTTAAG